MTLEPVLDEPTVLVPQAPGDVASVSVYEVALCVRKAESKKINRGAIFYLVLLS